MPRIYISYYQQGGGSDVAIAVPLRDALRARGRTVFLDDGSTPTGTATTWRPEIEQSDVFVVLLSHESATSAPLLARIRHACRMQRRNNKPEIIPVRVEYNESLDYALDWYIGWHEYIKCAKAKNLAPILDRIELTVAAEVTDDKQRPTPTQSSDSSNPASRPPTVPPALLAQPGMAIDTDHPLYVRRKSDEELARLAQSEGQTVIIIGPWQHGKSSLLLSYLRQCKERGKRAAFIDFGAFESTDFANYPNFLSRIGSEICDTIGIPPPQSNIGTQYELTRFLEAVVLGVPSIGIMTEPLVFAFDQIDLVIGQPYQRDFFGMLRHWHNRRSHPKATQWRNLDLALVTSLDPNQFIDNPHQSPFNVGSAVTVGSFSFDECIKLSTKFPTTTSQAEVEELYDLLRGHPYLTRLAHHMMLVGSINFDRIVEKAPDPDGPFADHLFAIETKLSADPRLKAAFNDIACSGSSESRSARTLLSMGLIQLSDNRYLISNMLYAIAFRGTR